MTVCIQCAMRAIVAGEMPPYFDETPEAHIARAHPDQEATQRERVELERQLAATVRNHGATRGRES